MALSDTSKGIIGCGCCCFWLIFFIIFLSISMKTLEQGHFGLVYSHYKQNVVGEPVTDPGIKWVGPLNSLVRFPSVNQMIYFVKRQGKTGDHEIRMPPVTSRTHDGLMVEVEISFQWSLQAAYLKDIYLLLGGAEDVLYKERVQDKPSFTAALVRFAQGSLTKVCSDYTAAQFFANQTNVENQMLIELKATFNRPQKGLVVEVAGLQLRSVDLPDAYEGSIADTQKEEQDYKTALAEVNTKKTQLSTVQMQSRNKQEQLMVDAKANAKNILETNNAWVDQYVFYQKKQAGANKAVLEALQNVSDPIGTLFDLMKQKAMKSHKSDKMSLTM